MVAAVSGRWCERCHGETHITTVSFFSDSIICLGCDKIERAHPQFADARRTFINTIRDGNHTFRGVGVPAGLTQQCIEARKARENV